LEHPGKRTEMTDREYRILNPFISPLDAMINVGACEDDTDTEETDTMDELRRVETIFNSFQERFSAFQAEIAVTVKMYKEDLLEVNKEIHELRDIITKTYSKVTNNLSGRVDRLEKQMEEAVFRREFNEALKAIRESMDENYRSTKRLMIQLILVVVGLFGTALGVLKLF
jgi:hypothetical protein